MIAIPGSSTSCLRRCHRTAVTVFMSGRRTPTRSQTFVVRQGPATWSGGISNVGIQLSTRVRVRQYSAVTVHVTRSLDPSHACKIFSQFSACLHAGPPHPRALSAACVSKERSPGACSRSTLCKSMVVVRLRTTRPVRGTAPRCIPGAPFVCTPDRCVGTVSGATSRSDIARWAPCAAHRARGIELLCASILQIAYPRASCDRHALNAALTGEIDARESERAETDFPLDAVPVSV